MNDHDTGAIVFPAASFAPDTDTVYDDDAANAELGVNVTVRVPSTYADEPATTPDGPDTPTTTEPATTDSENVAEIALDTATPVADDAGTRAVTVGAVVSTGAAVVNDHDTGAIVFPAASFAPDTDTVYDDDAANAADGVNVTVRVPSTYADEPATTPDGPDTPTTTEPATTDSENVADTVEVGDTPVAPDAGTRAVTVGAVVSTGAAVVNDHDTGAIVFPAASFAPDTDTVYDDDAANAELGVNVTVRVPSTYADEPATTPDGPDTPTTTEPATTDSENVAEIALDTATPVADDAGTRAVTVGAVVSTGGGPPVDVENTTSTQ